MSGDVSHSRSNCMGAENSPQVPSQINGDIHANHECFARSSTSRYPRRVKWPGDTLRRDLASKPGKSLTLSTIHINAVRSICSDIPRCALCAAARRNAFALSDTSGEGASKSATQSNNPRTMARILTSLMCIARVGCFAKGAISPSTSGRINCFRCQLIYPAR